MTSWTQAEENLVREWWGKFSASEISAKLHHTHTRNSVIGLVHRRRKRWGTPRQADPCKRGAGRRAADPAIDKIVAEEMEARRLRLLAIARRSQIKVVPFVEKVGTDPETLLVSKEAHRALQPHKKPASFDYRSDKIGAVGIPFARLGPLHCSWPLWVTGSDCNKRCCGERRHPESPYCIEHTRRAWQSRQKKKRKMKPI